MKLKTFFVLLLAATWGVGSWWWYTCKIKSYCSESSALSALIGTGIATLSAKISGETVDNDKPGTTDNAATSLATGQDENEQTIAINNNTADNGFNISNDEQSTADSTQNYSQPARTDTDDNQETDSTNDSSPDSEGADATEVATDSETDADNTSSTETEIAGNDPDNTANTEMLADTDSKPGNSDNTASQTNDNETTSSAGTTDTASATPAETASGDTVNAESGADADNTVAATPSPGTDAEPEKLPTIPEDKTDSDGDGLTDVVENLLTTDPHNPDSDGDGLSDMVELGDNLSKPLDSDNDGAIDAQDEDDDNDGDLTIDEMADPDKNGLPDDARDSNNDGIPDYLDKNSNQATRDDDDDGLLNGEEKRIGTNPTLTDSDGDGLSDQYEAEGEKDTDGDGTIDALDPDDDDDGIMTAMESADPNGDGNPEDALDSNNNNKPDYLDTDNTPDKLPDETEQQDVASEDVASEETEEKPAEAETASEDADNKSEDSDATAEDDKEANDNADGDSSEANAEQNDNAAADKPEAEQEESAEKQNDDGKVTVDTDSSADGDEKISPAKLYFPFRSTETELADSAAEYFDLVIKQLKDNPNVKIRITGHTDSVGRGAANRRLGMKRAEQVRDMLVKRGAPSAQIEVDSAGESEPVASNQTEAGRNKNRRVELEQIK